MHKHNGSFMSYQLNAKRKYDIAKVAQGVSVVHLYGEHLKGVNTYNPCIEKNRRKSLDCYHSLTNALQLKTKSLRT